MILQNDILKKINNSVSNSLTAPIYVAESIRTSEQYHPYFDAHPLGTAWTGTLASPFHRD